MTYAERAAAAPSGTWKVKASPEDGRIEVEGEVDSNRNAQAWQWSLRHNGKSAGLPRNRAALT